MDNETNKLTALECLNLAVVFGTTFFGAYQLTKLGATRVVEIRQNRKPKVNM